MTRSPIGLRNFIGSILSILCLLLSNPTSIHGQPADLIALWQNQNYAQCLQGLLAYHPRSEVESFKVDYMIATSACRIPGQQQYGYSYFNYILATYRMPVMISTLVQREWATCSNASSQPIVFTVAPQTIVRASYKRFSWLNHNEQQEKEISQGNVIATVLRKIQDSELQERLLTPDQRSSAISFSTMMIRMSATAGLLPLKDIHVVSVGMVTLASAGKQSDSELEGMAAELDRTLRFLVADYDMPKPSYLLTAYLVPSFERLSVLAERLHGLELSGDYTSYPLGYSYPDDLSMVGIVPTTRIGTLKHELFHLLAQKHFGNMPPWLNEGMAALYEVSEFEGDRLVGKPNWRGPILETLWQQRPTINELVEMNWNAFEAGDPETSTDHAQQGVNHATARYFVLYLQEQGKLKEVYTIFRTSKVEEMFTAAGDQRVHILEKVMQQSIDEIEHNFVAWFMKVGDWNADSKRIKQAQQRLKQAGIDPGPADGGMGSKTRKALKAFQAARQLPQTGKLDALTMTALEIKGE